MKRTISSLVLGLALVAGAIQTFAQETSKSVVITRDSKLGGEALAKGDYSVKFVEGKDGELVIAKGKREVIKATYKLTKLQQKASENSVVFTLAADGSYQIKRIEFKGKDEALT